MERREFLHMLAMAGAAIGRKRVCGGSKAR